MSENDHRSKGAQCCPFVLAKLGGSRDTRRMRIVLSFCLALACFSQAAVKAEAQGVEAFDLVRLEKEWHRCVRRSFAGQPLGLDNVAAQRAALAACKPNEDAYVSAVMIVQLAREDSLREDRDAFTSRARVWAGRLSAYVLDPLSSWLLGRDR
ncbi:hypothetical protein [Methylobacterium sp. WL19]|uniref:hypothetical protein n=1 Tax=Methylobacterium sp. WL19 TaxID=2603896 RepID=UPI0011C80559|nr:hypothetical protein [Methylobacterium sp. WL19]TXN29112.1 hypothetical protein FV220_07490 [Methylobacterium sp. WL19]